MKKTALLLMFCLPFTLLGQTGYEFLSAGAKTLPADKNTVLQKSTEVTTETVENLAVLCKVWGFLKYYHPKVMNGLYDWDQQLFNMIPAIMAAASPADRNAALLTWIQNVGATTPGTNQIAGPVKLTPDLDWIEDTGVLGQALSDQLTGIKNTARGTTNAYVSLVESVGNPAFNESAAYNTISDLNVRLLALFRYWNIIQYYFPYRHLIEEDWHTVLADEIPEFIDAATTTDYEVALLRLVARIHDTHAYMSPRNNADLALFGGFRYAPVRLDFIEGKVVVTGYSNENLGSISGLETGDVIVSVNGESVTDKIQRLSPYVAASNYSRKMRDIALNILRVGPDQDSIHVQYERAGSLFSRNIKHYSASESGINTDPGASKEPYSLLSDCVGYIYPGTIAGTSLGSMMEQLKNTEGIVVDMRCYPSEFIVFSLGRYFMPQPTRFVKFSNGSIRNPGYFAFVSGTDVGVNNPNYYNGKIVIIVNSSTLSQAEYTTMAFRVAPDAIVLGDTTAAADGNVSLIPLPGGYTTGISGIGVYYPNGGETQRVGVGVDVTVRPTIDAIREGRDELLEAAMGLICGPLSIKKNEEPVHSIKIYPVPAQNQVYVDCDFSGTAYIVDYLGRMLDHFDVNGQQAIDVSNMPDGIYNLVVLPEKTSRLISRKFVITH